jgi:predicted component of type VI protein secretion system
MAFLDITLSDSDYRRQQGLDDEAEYLVGRATGCSLRIAHRSLSRQHCALIPDDGTWQIEDRGSTNGTLLNGKRLMGRRRLYEGDHIVAGVAHLVFHVHAFSASVHATTYPALEVPSAIARKAEAVEHHMVGMSTDTQLPSPSDELEIATDDSVIDLDEDRLDPSPWGDEAKAKAKDTPAADGGTDSLWLD